MHCVNIGKYFQMYFYKGFFFFCSALGLKCWQSLYEVNICKSTFFWCGDVNGNVPYRCLNTRQLMALFRRCGLTGGSMSLGGWLGGCKPHTISNSLPPFCLMLKMWTLSASSSSGHACYLLPCGLSHFGHQPSGAVSPFNSLFYQLPWAWCFSQQQKSSKGIWDFNLYSL